MTDKNTKVLTKSLLDKVEKIKARQKGRKVIKKPPMITVVPTDNLQPVDQVRSETTHTKSVFVCDILNCSIKDDMASMEAPIFSLSTREDTREWKWVSEDGKRSISVVAVAKWGRATQLDKDILLYCISQLIAAINAGQTISKTVRFTIYSFLKATGRNTYGDDYERTKDSLNRLSGTRITTEIETGGKRVAEGFGLIDKWRVVEESETNKKMIGVEATLSDWTYNSVLAKEVLTLHPGYYKLRKPLERRLYEIARKHCGHQKMFKIGLDVLMKKAGVMDELRNFRGKIKNISKNNPIPDYSFELADNDIVVIKSA